MSRTSAFRDARAFAFVTELEACFDDVLAEHLALGTDDFVESADSLTTVRDGYDERGWLYVDLFGPGEFAENRARRPRAAAACERVPGLVNAGLSLFRPGTHLYPHRGELSGVLRCHLPLVVPAGDVGLRFGDEVRRWSAGTCLVFDDSLEHEAWNRGDGDRVVLLASFRP